MGFVIMKIKNNERKSKQLFTIIYKLIMNQSNGTSYTIINTCSRHRKFHHTIRFLKHS